MFLPEHRILEMMEGAGVFIRDGHFVLQSGRHADTYVEKRLIFERSALLDALSAELALRAWFCLHHKIGAVVGPETGGIMAAAALVPHLNRLRAPSPPVLEIHAFKQDGGFVFVPDDAERLAGLRVLIAEDVTTTGDTLLRLIRQIRAHRGIPVAASCYFNRGMVHPADLGLHALFALVSRAIPSWPQKDCGPCKRGVIVNRTHGHGGRASA